MPYVTSFEREGMFRLIEDVLRAKFGKEGAKLGPAIHELNDAEKYKSVNRAVGLASSLEEFRRMFAEVVAPPSRRRSKKRADDRPGRS